MYATINSMISSDKTQTMEVTVTFEYEADVYEDNDMYQLAQEEQDYLEEELNATLEEIVSVKKLKVKIRPKFN